MTSDLVYRYQAYGLCVASSRPLQGFESHKYRGIEEPNLQVFWLDSPPEVSGREAFKTRYSRDGSTPILQVWRGAEDYLLHYDDGTRFLVSRDGHQIQAYTSPSLSSQDTEVYLLGPLMGFVLRLRGTMCLHGSAVLRNGQAFAFLGLPGAGKSTTVALLAQAGLSYLSDDVLPIRYQNRRFEICSSYSRIRLWQSSESALGLEVPLAPLTPNWDKRVMERAHSSLQGEWKEGWWPLQKLFFLHPDQTEAPLNPLVELSMHSYVGDLLPRNILREQFGFLGKLVEQIPIENVPWSERKSAGQWLEKLQK